MGMKDSASVNVDDKSSATAENGRKIFAEKSSRSSTIDLVRDLLKMNHFSGIDRRRRIFSPRFMPLFEQGNATRTTSPDFLSLYSSANNNSIMSLPQLLREFGFTEPESDDLLQVIRQSVLSNEIFTTAVAAANSNGIRRDSVILEPNAGRRRNPSGTNFRQKQIFDAEHSGNPVPMQHLLDIAAPSKTLGAVYQLL